jgi:hypothetical protein
LTWAAVNAVFFGAASLWRKKVLRQRAEWRAQRDADMEVANVNYIPPAPQPPEWPFEDIERAINAIMDVDPDASPDWREACQWLANEATANYEEAQRAEEEKAHYAAELKRKSWARNDAYGRPTSNKAAPVVTVIKVERIDNLDHPGRPDFLWIQAVCDQDFNRLQVHMQTSGSLKIMAYDTAIDGKADVNVFVQLSYENIARALRRAPHGPVKFVLYAQATETGLWSKDTLEIGEFRPASDGISPLPTHTASDSYLYGNRVPNPFARGALYKQRRA